MSLRFFLPCLILYIGLVMSGGCYSPSYVPDEPADGDSGQGSFSLAAPSSVTADIVVKEGRFVLGAEADLSMPYHRTQYLPKTVVLTPDWVNSSVSGFDDLAYSPYSLQLIDYTGPAEIHLNWATAPLEGQAWLGLANWGRDWWDWYPVEVDNRVELPSLEPYMGKVLWPGRISFVVLCTGTQQSELNWLRVGGNLSPLADASATSSLAVPGEIANLNAGLSEDLDGAIVTYEWDLNDDGVFELNAGNEPEITTTFELPGYYPCALRVTDNLGASDVDFFSIMAGNGMLDEADFEDGWDGWVPDVTDVFVTTGDEIYWEIERNSQFPHSGSHSIWMIAENRTDACKLWIEKCYDLVPDTTYRVSLSYKFGSYVAGEVGAWTIIAGATNFDPEERHDIMGTELVRESTYNGGEIGYVWLDKHYEMEVTTDASGEIWVLVGVWGVMEVLQDYYIDDVSVQIISLE